MVMGPSWSSDGVRGEVEHPAKCSREGASGPFRSRSLYFAAVNAEFNWWLLIVGLVVGAGLVWLVVLDSRRRESDIDAAETAREALWLSTVLSDEGRRRDAGHRPAPARAASRLPGQPAAGRCPRTRSPRRRPVDADDAQDWPSSTGSASVAGEPTSTSDTPNVAGPSSPAIASDAPAQ